MNSSSFQKVPCLCSTTLFTVHCFVCALEGMKDPNNRPLDRPPPGHQLRLGQMSQRKHTVQGANSTHREEGAPQQVPGQVKGAKPHNENASSLSLEVSLEINITSDKTSGQMLSPYRPSDYVQAGGLGWRSQILPTYVENSSKGEI